MSQVRFAISAARSPALTDNSTISRLRSGCWVVEAKTSRSSQLSLDSILACLPGIYGISEKRLEVMILHFNQRSIFYNETSSPELSRIQLSNA
jgi:hypothetical protein